MREGPFVPSCLILALAEGGHNWAVRAGMGAGADRPWSSIASPTPTNPPRHTSSVRDILLPEVATERLFLGNDLHQCDDNHEQRWNEPRAGAAKPHRPSDQQQRKSQIHRIPTEAKDAVCDEVRSLVGCVGLTVVPT